MNEPVSSSEKRSISQLGFDVLDLDVQDEEESCTQEEILALLLTKSWRARFPPKLKTRYHAYSGSNQTKNYRTLAPLLLLLYFPLAATVAHHLPEGSFLFWLSIDIWIPVLLISGVIFTLIPALDRWYQVYIGGGGAIIIAITIIVVNVFPLGEGTIVAYAAIMYAVLAVYSFVGLRFSSALWAGWLGGVAGVIGTYSLGANMNWPLLHQTFTCTSIFGMGLAYATDRRERNKFLQKYLLQLCLVGSEALSKRLEELSRQDTLTGLANRRHLNEKMNLEWSRELRHQQPLTLMMIDVDFFKHYNDTLGHVEGDKCLQQIGQLLLSLTSRSGELAARYGGEEFVLLFPEMDRLLAEQQAQRLMIRMADLAIPDVDGHSVTFSVGIAVVIPTLDSNVGQLLRQADIAVYKAKENGRNRYEFYDDSMNGGIKVAQKKTQTK